MVGRRPRESAHDLSSSTPSVVQPRQNRSSQINAQTSIPEPTPTSQVYRHTRISRTPLTNHSDRSSIHPPQTPSAQHYYLPQRVSPPTSPAKKPYTHHQQYPRNSPPSPSQDIPRHTRPRRRERERESGKRNRLAAPRIVQNSFLVIVSILLVFEISQTFQASMGTSTWTYPVPLGKSLHATMQSFGSPARNTDSVVDESAVRARVNKQAALAAAYSSGGAGVDKKKLSSTLGPSSLQGSKAEASTEELVWSWFEQAAQSLSKSVSDTADAASAALKEAARYAAAIDIKEGLIQLPGLIVSASQPASLDDEDEPPAPTTKPIDRAPGASWSSSAWGALNSLPAYLKAVALHAAPTWTAEEAQAILEERGSIFTARQKGDWMGCTQPYHLICKGVYRAIKVVNAVTLLDTLCTQNAPWLPLVLTHLRREFRFVKLICADRDSSRREYVQAAYDGLDDVTFTTFDPFNTTITNQTDLVIAIKLLDRQSMIRGMKFFKTLQKSATAVTNVVYENYPTSMNRRGVGTNSSQAVRMNTRMAPFMFGRPIFKYQNQDEAPTFEAMEVVTMAIPDLFANKETPKMAELGDPRLRKRRVEPK